MVSLDVGHRRLHAGQEPHRAILASDHGLLHEFGVGLEEGIQGLPLFGARLLLAPERAELAVLGIFLPGLGVPCNCEVTPAAFAVCTH